MTKKPARPWTVWSTQVIAALMTALFAYSIFLAITTLSVQATPREFRVGLGIVLGCGYLTVLIGLALRSSVGRWLGVLGLLLPAVLLAFFVTSLLAGERGLEKVMSSYGSMAALLLFTGSILFFNFLAYRLARGNRETAFFSRPGQAITDPPPPPVFDRA